MGRQVRVGLAQGRSAHRGRRGLSRGGEHSGGLPGGRHLLRLERRALLPLRAGDLPAAREAKLRNPLHFDTID